MEWTAENVRLTKWNGVGCVACQAESEEAALLWTVSCHMHICCACYAFRAQCYPQLALQQALARC